MHRLLVLVFMASRVGTRTAGGVDAGAKDAVKTVQCSAHCSISYYYLLDASSICI
uniref:Uncharacterized protein n=1 Tax=Setaria viridis TaxID=4556 RepID=A0A4U6U1X2_SETVI|nr:hypothetical protein SEVIR_6G107850v2 [Setaria viridis]